MPSDAILRAPIPLASIFAACWLWLGLSAHAAEGLYTASVRGTLGNDVAAVAGSLYRVDPDNGAITLVGPLRIDGQLPIGITGLADHPRGGILYGITSGSSPNHPHSLVTIDVASGRAQLVGDLGAVASDIAFDAAGNLFAWLPRSSQVAVIDLSNGVARPIGPAGRGSETGGLAIDAQGHAWVASTGATGSIDSVDTNTGAVRAGPALTGTPFPGGINSLTFSPRGRLYAVNTNLGSPANTLLIAINPATGAVTQLGALPNDTDALVFVEPPWKLADLLESRATLTTIAVVVVMISVALVFVFGRR
jgi:sugar lactone lactonase YvrE